MGALLQEMRPRQWVKNGVLLAGVVFALEADALGQITRALIAFVCFCLLSSAGYVFNDLKDFESDRFHPRKRLRPIASGRISKAGGVALMVGLILLGLGGGFYLGISFFVLAAVYLLVSFIYTLILKRIVVLDVLGIALLFLLRASAGVKALDPAPVLSPWLLVCTLFLALFLAVAKRRHELMTLSEDATKHRSILSEYSPALLDQFVAIVTGATIIAYALYTIMPTGAGAVHPGRMIYTIPFVVYGTFRYLYLIYQKGRGGAPTEVLLTDGPLLAAVLLWGLVILAILYLG